MYRYKMLNLPELVRMHKPKSMDPKRANNGSSQVQLHNHRKWQTVLYSHFIANKKQRQINRIELSFMITYNLCASFKQAGLTVRMSGGTLRRQLSAEAPVMWRWRIIIRCSWPWRRPRLHRVTRCGGEGWRLRLSSLATSWLNQLFLSFSSCFGVRPGGWCRVTLQLLGASGPWRTAWPATCSTTSYGAAKRKRLVFLHTFHCVGLF